MTALLVSASDLASELSADPDAGRPPVVLDVRWTLGGPPGRIDHEAGHVPGAVFVDLDTELAGAHAPGSGRHPLPDRDRLTEVLRRAGVRRDSRVVVYDARDSTSAARAWWVLTWAGLRDVRVLDGGLAAWVATGAAVAAGPEHPEPGDVILEPGTLPTLDAGSAAAVARSGTLLDSRSAVRYRGEQEPVDPVAGHVPGAVSAPTTENVDASGRFLPPDALRERFAGLGAASGEVGVYCGSGVTGAHQVLALRLAGLDGVLYPGSWSAWITDPARPVATGPEPG
ncbi:sulfurtransferase [Kineococcus gynurae]|uniref:Sulfurtransferase n=1 Tax=Kineococcus gynurae TaxID=452979 RepID=A0ABV5LPM5_9ACTN